MQACFIRQQEGALWPFITETAFATKIFRRFDAQCVFITTSNIWVTNVKTTVGYASAVDIRGRHIIFTEFLHILAMLSA